MSTLRSIRTKFGLVTACILLGLLFAFYLGGRFILVGMIRETEKDIQVIGNDIKSVVYDELGTLQRASATAADTLSRSSGEATHAFLQAQLGSFTNDTPVNLAITLGADGSFKKGCCRVSDQPIQLVEAADVQPYLTALLPLLLPDTGTQHPSGVIAFKSQPLFFALSPVKNQAGTVTGFILIGSLLHNNPLISRINEATHGMQVSVSDRRIRRGASAGTNEFQRMGPSPVFHEAQIYYSGGNWHMGENTFEAIMPITDILGREVTVISIRLPSTFASITRIALGRLTAFVALIGMFFVLPIFWLQTRIVLNPLSKIAEQIRMIGETHLSGRCSRIDWPKKDEFGILAQSVNGMLESLSRQTKHIQQIEQRQNALIAGMPDCLCIFDTYAHLIAVHKQPDYANPIPGLIVGRSVSPPLFPESDCEALRKAIGETFQTDKIQVVIISCRESDGSYRHLETRISRMDAYFALVVLRDVTKEWHERETRELVEDRLAKIKKMESLGNLAVGIAHDFNNILSIIQNTVDLAWDKQGTEAVGTIRQATDKGAALTRELMTYAGQTRIAFKHEEPNTLILDLEKLMGGVVEANVALELKLTPGLPFVDVDPHQFWKVIINLLKNASESMNGARGNIRISTYPFELTQENIEAFFSTHELSPGNGVVFQIDDTGSGISREVIGRLFEPFFSTKAVGRGLGLSTVFGIVDAHSGGIAIDSEIGKGTSFRIWLPASKERAEEQPPPLAELPATPPPVPHDAARALQEQPSQPPCVLLIEDDRAILHSTTLMLRTLNVTALQAATKREALMLFRKHADSIGLILLDSQLGHLDNVRLLATLRMRKPDIPVVIVSGHTEERIREMFAEETFDGFLSKPYTMRELENILDPFTHRLHTS